MRMCIHIDNVIVFTCQVIWQPSYLFTFWCIYYYLYHRDHYIEDIKNYIYVRNCNHLYHTTVKTNYS